MYNAEIALSSLSYIVHASLCLEQHDGGNNREGRVAGSGTP